LGQLEAVNLSGQRSQTTMGREIRSILSQNNQTRFREILQAGYPINNVIIPDTQTRLLHVIAMHPGDKVAFVRILVEQGADVDALDSNGNSVLFYAAEQGNAQTVAELISHGALPRLTRPIYWYFQ